MTTGSCDGVEMYKLNGSYLLDKLSLLLHKQNLGLCRDNTFVVIKNVSGPELDNLRRETLLSSLKLSLYKNTIERNRFFR